MKAQTWLITGASGLIGTELVPFLIREGHEVRTLSRSPQPHQPHAYVWDPASGILDKKALENVDVVVHLAGASVGQRWTPQHKRDILESRVSGTSLLAREAQSCGFEGTWIQASAVGYYGNTCEPQTEKAAQGDGFLADVVKQWENASHTDSSNGFRRVHLRLGLVFSGKGGTLSKLWPIYQTGLGAPLGSGTQCMSWIHLEDVVRLIHWASTSEVEGACNACAPEATTNRAFSQALAAAVRRPHWAPAVPAWALRLAMGEMSSLMLQGQNVVPQVLLHAGFEWRYPELQEALEACAAER